MTDPELTPAAKPTRPFGPWTLLLLLVVLGSSLAVFGAWGVVAFVLTVGLAIYLNKVKSLWSLIYLAMAVLCLMCLLWLPAVEAAKQAGRRAQCSNNLHQIAAALYAYHQAHGSFPPAHIADKTGKPMHSWRVLILPFMELDALYKMYKFSEAWDGPNNKKLAMPVPIYACPSNGPSWTTPPFETSYVALVGPKGEWPSEMAMTNAADGEPSSLIMVVEVADSGISWMEPKDLPIDALQAAETNSSALIPSSKHDPQSGFFLTYDHSGFQAAMADGSVQFLPPGTLSKASMVRLNWPNIAALAVWLLSVGTLLTRAMRSRKRRAVQSAAEG